MDIASAVTLVPVLAELFDTAQTAGFVAWNLPVVVTPVLTVTTSITGQAGEVDKITITASTPGDMDFTYI
jgi:hypothetical protein